MLVLSRKEDQSITVRDRETGKEIQIVLIGLRASCVKIGIQADSNFLILRGELDKDAQGNVDGGVVDTPL